MKAYVAEVRTIAEGTLACTLVPEAPFAFQAGQFVELAIASPRHTDARGSARMLSIASAPGEPVLTFATRTSTSAFKRSLAALRPGDVCVLSAPGGAFVRQPDTRPHVLIAGGVGITPVRAIVRAMLRDEPRVPVAVVHLNRNPRSAPFFDEFVAAARARSWLVYHPVFDEGGGEGAQGPADAAWFTRHLPDLAASWAYVVGPPPMVQAIGRVLDALEVPPAQRVLENFAGY
ncbi:MAG: FAD-dependent oxidoreductase [Zetaproteobacteria bacterium]|nr:MAG: FAD-dependent oxidoreductase [Zetaproteobacteria bacterium]